MTKLYESGQRIVCAAYVNEMVNTCDASGINGFKVAGVAAPKPSEYFLFEPGPGVDGHCIPANPYYLLSTCEMPLLKQATTTIWQRSADISERFMKSLIGLV